MRPNRLSVSSLNRLLRASLPAAALAAATGQTALAQVGDPSDNRAPVAARIEALKADTARKKLASEAFEAADKAREAATAADKAAQGLASAGAVTAEIAAAAAASAANASQRSAAAARAANLAAAATASGLARERASVAAVAASVAAGEAERAAKAAEKARDDLSASQGSPARIVADRIVEQTRVAAQKAREAALKADEAGLQAAEPDQPVTTSSDENVFTALRARFVGGAVFFNGAPTLVTTSGDKPTAAFKSDQFSQAAIYLGLESQPRLWSFGRRSAGGEFALFYTEPFLNVRLTSIPVGSGGPIAGPDAGFVKSEKAIQTQLGALLSWNFGHFVVGDTGFHWGAAVAARAEFSSVTDANRSVRIWNVEDDLYTAKAFGVRLTLYEKGAATGPPRVSWAPVGYVDVAAGKFQNFEVVTGNTPQAQACLQNPAKCLESGLAGLPPSSDFSIVQEWRLVIEARLMLKYVYLGIDINNGKGGDDARIVAGLSVKLDRFMKRQ